MKFKTRISEVVMRDIKVHLFDLATFINGMAVFHAKAQTNLKLMFFAKMLDCDGDELISKVDVYQFFKKASGVENSGLGQKMSFIELEFDSMDKDNDGLIPLNEFVNQLCQKDVETINQILTVDFRVR